MHLEEWITEFSEGNTKGRDFFATKKDKGDEACPTYARGGASTSVIPSTWEHLNRVTC